MYTPQLICFEEGFCSDTGINIDYDFWYGYNMKALSTTITITT